NLHVDRFDDVQSLRGRAEIVQVKRLIDRARSVRQPGEVELLQVPQMLMRIDDWDRPSIGIGPAAAGASQTRAGSDGGGEKRSAGERSGHVGLAAARERVSVGGEQSTVCAGRTE